MEIYKILITLSDDKYAAQRNPDLPAPEKIEETLRGLVEYWEEGRGDLQKEKIEEAASILLQDAIIHAVNTEEIKKMGDAVNTDLVDVGPGIRTSRWSINAEERLKKIGKIYSGAAVEVVKTHCQ
jgi:hypothetical protein